MPRKGKGESVENSDLITVTLDVRIDLQETVSSLLGLWRFGEIK